MQGRMLCVVKVIDARRHTRTKEHIAYMCIIIFVVVGTSIVSLKIQKFSAGSCEIAYQHIQRNVSSHRSIQ